MTVDVRLLAIVALPLAYLFAFMQLGFWLYRRERRVHLYWALANLVGALGATLLVLRHHLPLWITTSLANTIILASTFMLWMSMARFAGHARSWRPFVFSVGVFFCLFQGLWAITDDLGMRVLLVSLASAIANAGVAWELLLGQQQLRLRSRGVLSLVFVLHALFHLFRAATAVTLDASKDFLQANGIQNLSIIITAIKLIAWNVLAVLMVREQQRQS